MYDVIATDDDGHMLCITQECQFGDCPVFSNNSLLGYSPYSLIKLVLFIVLWLKLHTQVIIY